MQNSHTDETVVQVTSSSTFACILKTMGNSIDYGKTMGKSGILKIKKSMC